MSQYSAESAVISSVMILLRFSLSRRDENAASTSRSRTQNRQRHSSSSSDSSTTGPARHRHGRHSPVEVTWVPAGTSKPHLSYLVGSSKFTTSRSFDDSRVNPERKRNLSDDVAGEVFGPTLPPSDGTKKRSSKTDSSDAETRTRQRQSSRDVETTASTGKKVSRTDERRHSSQKIRKSRESSSTSRSPRRSSHSRSSSSSTSSAPASKSKKKISRTKSRSSVSVSGSRKTRISRSSSSGSSSGTKKRRKRVRQSTSSSSRSSGSDSSSRARRVKSTTTRSRKDRFEAQNGHRSDRQGFRRDSRAGEDRRAQTAKDRRNLSFSSHRKSRSGSRDRSGKHMPIQQANWTSPKGKNFDHRSRMTSNHKEPGSAVKSDVTKNMRTETGVKRLADYSSSSDDERTKTGQTTLTGIPRTPSTAARKTVDSKKPIPGRRSDTAVTGVADSGKGTDIGETTKTDDKPKETLEDMELFLKQLKANKQQQMLKKQ